MAVHSIPPVVVVPATSDREYIPFGRGFTLKDPQAAGGQYSGSGKVVFMTVQLVRVLLEEMLVPDSIETR